jgi:hypothetical protein
VWWLRKVRRMYGQGARPLLNNVHLPSPSHVHCLDIDNWHTRCMDTTRHDRFPSSYCLPYIRSRTGKSCCRSTLKLRKMFWKGRCEVSLASTGKFYRYYWEIHIAHDFSHSSPRICVRVSQGCGNCRLACQAWVGNGRNSGHIHLSLDTPPNPSL